MAEKLRDLRALLSRTNVKLLSLRSNLNKEANGSAGSGAVEVLTGKTLQAFVVDTADAHQSEYVSDANKRREFLSGFTGSNGTGALLCVVALVTPDKALLWTDGRYFLQAENELSAEWTLMKSEEPGVPTIEETQVELVALHETENFVDQIWEGRPATGKSQVKFLSEQYTGRSVAAKLADVRSAVKEKGADAIVLTALDDIAWLFNIRGNDVEFNPVVVSYAIVTSDSATLFLDAANHDEVTKHFASTSDVVCKPYADVLDEIAAYATANKDKKILVDPVQCNVAVFLAIPADMRKEGTSVVMAQKAIKSEVEIEGMRQAHIRDGAALTKYFSWLEHEAENGRLDQYDEVQVADKQQELREQMEGFVSLSFDTISSIGPNGAIIHYKPKRDACPKLSTKAMYLNDSGAQYLDGTTDVTRTLHFGTPTAYEKACYTYVLKAHIALARAVFPDKIEGVKLDAITRAPLWQAGLDYRHGTGHGVGAFLNVHEKGVLLSFRLNPNGLLIQDGMILSNEPGYYENGNFGIRIESLMVAKKAAHIKSPLGKDFCEFETITMAPIQQKLIEKTLLDQGEVDWLNAYHHKVHEKLKALLESDTQAYAYLMRETAPLSL
ncbi:Xaa-pro aminopeptidase, partial [Globisporangium splendens]